MGLGVLIGVGVWKRKNLGPLCFYHFFPRFLMVELKSWLIGLLMIQPILGRSPRNGRKQSCNTGQKDLKKPTGLLSAVRLV